MSYKRRRMSKRYSKRNFRKGNKVKSRNSVRVMRGGHRI